MFEKLKQKLKKVVERITKKTTEEVPVEVPTEKPIEIIPEALVEAAPETPPEVPAEVKPEAPPEVPVEVEPEIPSKVPALPKVAPKVTPPAPEAPPAKPKILPPTKPKVLRRVVARIARRELTPADVEDIIWELQVGLLESDVAVPVSDKIIDRTKELLTGRKLGLTEDPKKLVEEILRQVIREVLSTEKKVDVLELIKTKRAKGEPAVFVFLGINGHGKTTTVAKFAKYIVDHGYKPILAAADTFRAAGIEQLEIHAERLGLEVVKQRRGADAAAVAFDAIAHAKAKGFDVVLIDTAGRMQTDVNLMDEMKKIVRVSKPDLKIFIGDALTGNDAVEQAATFDKAVGIDGSILCKMDADARGGAALSITQVTGKPILFLGTGQDYKDLVEFDPDFLLKALFSD
jgi:fused signal recognition particle receptor